jgi:hypothetical protein
MGKLDRTKLCNGIDMGYIIMFFEHQSYPWLVEFNMMTAKERKKFVFKRHGLSFRLKHKFGGIVPSTVDELSINNK